MNDSDEASNSPQEKQLIKMPKILFLYSFDYFDESRNTTSYIDEDGNVYSINLSLDEQNLNLQQFYERIKLSKDDITNQVDKEQLKAMYEMFLQVPKENDELENMTSFTRITEEEKGEHRYYGFLFNENGELEYILLDTDGDYGYKSKNKTAQELVLWLKTVLYEYQYYEQ